MWIHRFTYFSFPVIINSTPTTFILINNNKLKNFRIQCSEHQKSGSIYNKRITNRKYLQEIIYFCIIFKNEEGLMMLIMLLLLSFTKKNKLISMPLSLSLVKKSYLALNISLSLVILWMFAYSIMYGNWTYTIIQILSYIV